MSLVLHCRCGLRSKSPPAMRQRRAHHTTAVSHTKAKARLMLTFNPTVT